MACSSKTNGDRAPEEEHRQLVEAKQRAAGAGVGDAEDHGGGGYWRGDGERKAAATRGGRRSDGEVVEALVAEVDGEWLGAAADEGWRRTAGRRRAGEGAAARVAERQEARRLSEEGGEAARGSGVHGAVTAAGGEDAGSRQRRPAGNSASMAGRR